MELNAWNEKNKTLTKCLSEYFLENIVLRDKFQLNRRFFIKTKVA